VITVRSNAAYLSFYPPMVWQVLNDGGASDQLGLVVELCSFGPVMQFRASPHGRCRFSPGRAALALPIPKKATRGSPESTSLAAARTAREDDYDNDDEEEEEDATPVCPAVRAEDELSWGLPPLLAAKWGRDLLRGVAYLHEVGVAHRDLKVSSFDGFTKLFASILFFSLHSFFFFLKLRMYT